VSGIDVAAALWTISEAGKEVSHYPKFNRSASASMKVCVFCAPYPDDLNPNVSKDINLRMPREEAGAIYDLIKPIALGIDPKLFIQIMGSFRRHVLTDHTDCVILSAGVDYFPLVFRGKATCGDIDILISRDPSDGKTHAGVSLRLLVGSIILVPFDDDCSKPHVQGFSND
jgi:hypothetical protein